MAMPMGPPQLPGYSLRVQLFSPDAHDLADKPMRCFRVVTSPDRSIREFCEEASRIHEINYGEPLAVKKCQDDQEFDVTQSEILGNLFVNAATIRVIRALPSPGVRDSVPPTSALRFEPPTRKRGRESSPTGNISAPSNSYKPKPNKRQRLTSLNPDHPLPSREGELERGGAPSENGRIPDINVIPSSQESVILGTNHGFYGTSRQVRPNLPQIPETPSPSPPSSPSPLPAFKEQPYYEKHPTDHQGRKPANSNENSNHNSEADNSSPLKQASARAQSLSASQTRAKSASYHIQRATERGTSVSTAATSPLSTDLRHPARNGLTPGAKRKISDSSSNSSRQNGKRNSRSPNEVSIYENIVSEDESAAILNATKATLKLKKSQSSGLQGMEWANNRFNTPPDGRRTSRGPGATPGELPLTPSSKERERKQRDANDAKEARQAAAKAAEQRKREAEEAKAAEEEQVARQNQAKREELERIEVETFKRGEAERAAVNAKAARLEKERAERDRKQAEDLKKKEEERRKEEQRLEKEKAAKQKLDAENILRNKAMLAEATRKREEEERIQAEHAAKERPSSPELARKPSPAIVPGFDGRRPSSSTSLFPSGRKSSLKTPIRSSQAIASSSPSAPNVSPERTVNSVSLGAEMPKNRRVSFEEPPRKETPIRPPTRILPPGRTTTPIVPKPVTAKPVQKVQVPFERRSRTPIRPPPTMKRPSIERSTTPVVPPKVAESREEVAPQAVKKTTPPQREINDKESTSNSPPTIPAAIKVTTPVQPSTKAKMALEFLRTIEPTAKEATDAEETSADESDEEVPSKSAPSKATSKSPAQSEDEAPAHQVASESEPEPESEDEQEEEDEIASNPSSTRDSRSPVVFSQHAGAVAGKSNRSPSPESGSESDNEHKSDSDSSEASLDLKKNQSNHNEIEGEASDGEEAEKVPESSPTLPRHKPTAKPSGPAFDQVNSKKHTTGERDTSTSTQGEIDHQLTSSMYEVRRSPPKSLPSSMRPSLRVGASLQALNSRKATLSSSTVRKPPASQQQTLKEASGSEDESEEESNDSDSDGDEETAKRLASALRRSSQQRTKPEAEPVGSGSDSDDAGSSSNSDADADEDEDLKQMRDEVAAKIADGSGLLDSQKSSGSSVKSPRVWQDSQLKEKKRDKYISGQTFSQPSL